MTISGNIVFNKLEFTEIIVSGAIITHIQIFVKKVDPYFWEFIPFNSSFVSPGVSAKQMLLMSSSRKIKICKNLRV